MNTIIFFALMACGDSNTTPSTPEAKDNANNEKNTAPPKQNKSAKSSMPDLLKGLVTDGCDNGPGVFGAADYFHNTIEIADDGSVTGTEVWILHANKKMKAKWDKENIASPCRVTWKLKGKKQASTGKGDLGLDLINNLTDTTCPKEMVNKYEDTGKKIAYNVARNDDGTAQFFFASVKFVGQGHHDGNNLQFITNKSCRWF